MALGDAEIHDDESGVSITTQAAYAGSVVSCIWNSKEFLNQETGEGGWFGNSNIIMGPWGVSPMPYVQNLNTNGILESFSSWQSNGHGYINSVVRLRYNDAGQTLSNDYATISISTGAMTYSRAIRYHIAFELGEDHPPGSMEHFWSAAILEWLYWVAPSDFNTFYTLDIATEDLTEVNEFGGGYNRPVIMATSNGAYAVGVFISQMGGNDNSDYKVTNVVLHNPIDAPTLCPTWWSKVGLYAPYNNGLEIFYVIGSLAQVKGNLIGINNQVFGALTPPSGLHYSHIGANLSNILRWRTVTKIADTGFRVNDVDIAQLYEDLKMGTTTDASGYFKKNGVSLSELFARNDDWS